MRNLWLFIFCAVLIWSGYEPKDYVTWVLEVAPAVIGLAVLAATYKKFPLTGLVYLLILLHCIVLMVGGHYSYSEVPLFDTIKEAFNMQRNNYDKVGHFFQGFVPAMIARELIERLELIKQGAWSNFFIVSFCLALSAVYEMIEWMVAVIAGGSAEAFLGTQGYEWDAQADMMWALIGAVAALVMLRKLHDRQLAGLALKTKN